MTVRPWRGTDVPALMDIAVGTGYPYPSTCDIKAHAVVVDDSDRPLIAAAITLQPQAYLYVGQCTPAQKLQALRMLHVHLGAELRKLGYHSIDCEVPPDIAQRFGKRLSKMGWIENTWRKWFFRV